MTRCDFCLYWQPLFDRIGNQIGFKCMSSNRENNCFNALKLMTKTLSSSDGNIYLTRGKVE